MFLCSNGLTSQQSAYETEWLLWMLTCALVFYAECESATIGGGFFVLWEQTVDETVVIVERCDKEQSGTEDRSEN